MAHPIQTQAVVYITQRFASLATLFYLLSFVAYIEYRLSRGSKLKTWSFYAASLFSAALGMLTKEITFTLPVMVALYEFMFLRGDRKKRIALLLPVFLTALIIPFTLLMTKGSVTGISGIDESMKTLAAAPTVSRSDYLLTQFRVIVTYLRLLFKPVNQNLDYDYQVYHSFFTPPVFFSFLLLLCLFGMAVYLAFKSRIDNPGNPAYLTGRYRWIAPVPRTPRELRLTAFGIFWFFITLSMESSIIPIADVIFEHRVYLPSVGFLIGIVTLVFVLARKAGGRLPYGAGVTVSVLAMAVFFMACAAYARNLVWKDELTLWQDASEKSPLKFRPHYNLGLNYAELGRTADAIREYETAIRIDPSNSEAHNNLGIAYAMRGEFDKAVTEIQLALQLNPLSSNAYNNLGSIYANMRLWDRAIECFKTAIALKPEDVTFQNRLARAYEEKKAFDANVRK